MRWLVLLALGCPDYGVCPEPKPEDLRLCAPTHYPNACLEALGYRTMALPCPEATR